jgi:hypothetical protein
MILTKDHKFGLNSSIVNVRKLLISPENGHDSRSSKTISAKDMLGWKAVKAFP